MSRQIIFVRLLVAIIVHDRCARMRRFGRGPGSLSRPSVPARPPPPPATPRPRRGGPESSPPSSWEPPVASLAAEGGDPVAGSLGSFTWGDGGSDSPWLAGAPITAGSGEQFTVRWPAASRLRTGRRTGAGRGGRWRERRRGGDGAASPITFPAPAQVRGRSRSLSPSATISARPLTSGRSPCRDPAHPRGTLPTPMPTSTRRRLPLPAVCAALVVVAAACTNPATSGEPASRRMGSSRWSPDGDETTLVGWDGSGREPIPIKLPKGDVVWVATGLQDVLAAVRDDGTSATSDPRPPRQGARPGGTSTPKDPSGKAPAGPAYFAAWEPDGGRYAMLAGDLLAGEDIRVVLIDPALSTAFEIELDGSRRRRAAGLDR